MAEFIELHKKSLVDEKTFAVLQNVNDISEICETPRREALISLRNNPVASYYDRFETAETYEQIKQLLSECGSIATADVAPVVHGQWNIMDGAKTRLKHGQWEWFDENTGTPITGYEREWGWRCSRCKHELPDDYDDPDYRPMLDYCPYCGAEMDGGANNG